MNERDEWGRSVYRANDPRHNAIVHILDWDARDGVLVRNIVFSEPPGPPPPLGTIIGTRPGEVEVASAEFDYRLGNDPDVYKRHSEFHELWNVVDTQPCGCGCDERKRRGVMALRRESQHAETMAFHDNVGDEPAEMLHLSSEALALAEAEAKTRNASVQAVIEVALRYFAIDRIHPNRRDLLPFSLAQDATAALSADLGMGVRFTPDAVDVVAWFTRFPSYGLTHDNILSHAIERFCALSEQQRDEEWRTNTSAY